MVTCMDTLHSSTTKKYFNTLMNIGTIARCYKNNSFPDSYCLVTCSLDAESSIATEEPEIVQTENRKVVNRDGVTRFIIH